MLPTALATTDGMQLTTVDILPLSATVPADSNGVAVIAFDQVDPGYLWLITAMSVRAVDPNSTTKPRVSVMAGPRLLDGSDKGQFDISDRSSPILVNSGEQLQVIWTGATPGGLYTFDGQYNLVRRGV
jgi:hypothetical protein